MPFSPAVKELALVACERHCCLCHKFCGTNMECHHIKQEAHEGENTAENCIPLCFDCHADVNNYNIQHPKGNKYTPSELIKRRDTWYAKVAQTGGTTANEEYIAIDRQLFQELKEKLPSVGSISYIRTHNFAASYNLLYLDEMYNFAKWGKLPENEFLDADLEALKANLIESIETFGYSLGTNTWHNTVDFYHVPPEWEYKQPDRYRDVVMQLNTESDQVCENYDSLIKTMRRRLKVR